MDILDLINEGKVKRLFRARNKIIFPGSICHITQRAPGKELLFLEETDYLYMLHLLKKTTDKFNFKLLSFAFMPNHIHLLNKFSEANASKAMKNLNERYAGYFNKKYERKGHVFCGPYRSALCFDETYLLAASLYIHLNPVKAGLVKNAQEYRWSSCSVYLNPPKKESFLDSQTVLQVLDEDLCRARQIYKKFLENAKATKIESVLENPQALESFRIKLIDLFPNIFDLKKITQENRDFFDEQGIEERIRQLRQKKRLKSAQDIKARRYLIEQLKSRGYTIEEIIERLRISRRTFYYTFNCTK